MESMKSTRELYQDWIRPTWRDRSGELYWPVQMILSELGIGWQRRRGGFERLRDIFVQCESEPLAARLVSMELGAMSMAAREKIDGRALLIASQVQDHLRGRTLLDLGCGNGKVGLHLAELDFDVTQYDVADYRCMEARRLTFDDDWPNRNYETTLLVAVLHHCEEPDAMIARLSIAQRRLVVIESVIDVMVPRGVQATIDWLYNRGMHPEAGIPVPGEFRTAEGWTRAFERRGWAIEHSEDLGVDLPIVPERHHLFVCVR